MRIFLLTLFLLVLGSSGLGIAEPPLRIVQLSDPHVGHPAYSQEMWDVVWKQSLAESAEVMLLSGDQVDNRGSFDGFLARTKVYLKGLSRSLESRPEILAITLGNNDLWPNHNTDPAVLQLVVGLYNEALGERSYLDELGNGVLPDRPGQTVWITLNAQIFSRSNPYTLADDQAQATLQWLDGELAKLKPNQTVILLPHIAPVMDIWSEKPAWREPWAERFRQVLAEHPQNFVLLSGHFHRNEIQSLDLGDGRVAPIFVSGAMSRKYDYQLNWRSYELSNQDIRYKLFYPQCPDWNKDYTLSNIFRESTFLGLRRLLEQSPNEYERYAQDLYAGHAQWRERSSNAKTRKWILDLMARPEQRSKAL